MLAIIGLLSKIAVSAKFIAFLCASRFTTSAIVLSFATSTSCLSYRAFFLYYMFFQDRESIGVVVVVVVIGVALANVLPRASIYVLFIFVFIFIFILFILIIIIIYLYFCTLLVSIQLRNISRRSSSLPCSLFILASITAYKTIFLAIIIASLAVLAIGVVIIVLRVAIARFLKQKLNPKPKVLLSSSRY